MVHVTANSEHHWPCFVLTTFHHYVMKCVVAGDLHGGLMDPDNNRRDWAKGIAQAVGQSKPNHQCSAAWNSGKIHLLVLKALHMLKYLHNKIRRCGME